MNHAGSSWGVVLLVALVAGCGDEERDSGIYGSGSATYDGPDDEADEAESGEGESTTTTTATTTADDNPTTDDNPDTDADASTSSSSSDDDPSTTSTTESESGDPACGNGVIDNGEQCDGGQLAGFDCTDLGYSGGTLACDPAICVYDASGCTNDGTDGNNNDCGTYCDECTCPSNACTMCCAQMGKVDACGGGMCSCF